MIQLCNRLCVSSYGLPHIGLGGYAHLCKVQAPAIGLRVNSDVIITAFSKF